MHQHSVSKLSTVAIIIAMLLWGFAWSAGKLASQHSNPQVAAFWRYAVSFITIIPVIWFLKTPINASKKAVLYMLLAGILTSLFNYLFFAGLVEGNAGYGGTIVTSIAPIFTYIFSIIFFGIKISKKQLFAIFIGFLGALILLRVPLEGFSFLTIESSYFLGCAIVWAMVTIISQKTSSLVDPMLYSVVVFGIVTFVNMLFALPYHPFEVANYDQTFWVATIFIGVLAGTFATTLYFIFASKIGAHKTGIYMFIVPLGAIISSWFIYGEEITASSIIGLILAFVAVIIFNIKYEKLK